MPLLNSVGLYIPSRLQPTQTWLDGLSREVLPQICSICWVFCFTVSKLKEAEKFLPIALHFYSPEGEESSPWYATQVSPHDGGQQSRQGAMVCLCILLWPHSTLHHPFFWHLQPSSILSLQLVTNTKGLLKDYRTVSAAEKQNNSHQWFMKKALNRHTRNYYS